MSSARGGRSGARGFQRGGDRAGGGRFGVEHRRGLKDNLPTLNLNASGKVLPEAVERFIQAMKIHCISDYVTGLDSIFNKGELAMWPGFDEPELPEDPKDIFEVEKWKNDYKFHKDMERLVIKDGTKLFGVIMGQLGQASIDAINKTTQGKAAIDEKDALELIKAIYSTHMISAKIDNTLNLYEAEGNFRELRMGEDEGLDSWLRRFNGSENAYMAAAERAEKGDQVPDEEQRALHFVKKLNSKYSDFVSDFDRDQLRGGRPETVQKALEAVFNYGPNKRAVPAQSQGQSRGAFYAGRGRGRGGGRGRWGRGACAICHKEGHWKNECPERSADQEDKTVASAVKEAGKGKKGKNG